MSARQPPEWAPHAATWTAWPSDPDLWADDLAGAQAEVAAMVRAVAEGEPVHVLVTAAAEPTARAAGLGENVTLHVEPFGDIWLRDTGPIFLDTGAAAGFMFNGWGGKYALPGDDTVADRVAALAGAALARHGWVLEGGAVDVDGTGLAVTTEQCLLNPNRGGLSRPQVETNLRRALGIDRVLWLGDGLAGDHTDGHVDNLARFVAPGVLAVPEPAGADDPNAEVYEDAAARARAFGLDLVRMPSPGRVEVEGGVVAASHMNFYVANACVVVPGYGGGSDAAAAETLRALFPTRAIHVLPAAHILTGGGAFHCITQQQPR